MDGVVGVNLLCQTSNMGQVILSVHVPIWEKGAVTCVAMRLKNSVAISPEKMGLTEAAESQEAGTEA